MDWSESTLGEIVEADGGTIQTGPFGSQLHQHEYQAEGVPVVMPKDISGGRVLTETVARVSEQIADRLARHKLRPGAIVLPRRGEIAKRAFIRAEQQDWLCGTGCLKIELNPESRLLPEFLYYYMEQSSVVRWLEQHAVGTTMLNLNTQIVGKLPIRYPRPKLQQMIVGALSAYDDLIENNRRRIGLLEEAARLLYREWFVYLRFPGHEHVKITNGLPEGWQHHAISEIAELFRGKSYTSAELVETDGQPFVNLKCIERFGGFRDSGLKCFRGKHKEHHLLRAGDIVIAVTDMTRDAMIVAQAARVPKTVGENAIFSMDLLKVLPKDGIPTEWLYGMFRFSSFSSVVREEATGATVLHLKPKHIEQWIALVPPPVLRDIYSEHVGGILEQIDNLELQNEKLSEARDLLLPRLMSGEIAV